MTPLAVADRTELASEVALLERAMRAAYGEHRYLDEVLANDELVYGRFSEIGCAGFLFDRASKRTHLLGSVNNIDAYLWAFYRGFDLTGDNRIRITAVEDRAAMLSVLRRGFNNRWLLEELEPRLDKLPIDLDVPSFSLYCMLGTLPACHAFDYEVNP